MATILHRVRAYLCDNPLTEKSDDYTAARVSSEHSLDINQICESAVSLGGADTGLSILQVTDIKTGSVNDRLTPHHILKITGHKIKLAGDDENVGISFVNQSTGENTRVDLTDIVTNNPSALIIMIPALTAGTYKLQVITQFSESTLLKEPRTVVFDKVLIV